MSTIKVDTVTTLDGTGNITLSRPLTGLSGSGASLTALNATQLTSGTIPMARLSGTLPALNGSALTALSAANLTGSIADARVPESAVTQHVTSLRADILNLALNQAIADNRVAFNLDNSFVDGFEDDTGITTETNVDRDTSGEYVSTRSSATVTYSSGVSPTYTTIGNLTGDFNASTVHGLITGSGARDTGPYTASASLNGGLKIDFGASYILNSGNIDIGSHRTNGDIRGLTVTYSTDDSTYSNMNFSSVSGSTIGYDGSVNSLSSGTSGGVINLSGHSAEAHRSQIRLANVPTVTARYIKVIVSAADFHNPNARLSYFDFRTMGATANATGTLISDAQTASSSRTSCSGVIMYENESGTATLGTDLKIYFTANNGTNWTEAASYGTATTYSGGKKLVKLGATTVTGGTQVALKAVWANQSTGSKVTRLHGWAVNY